MKIIAFGLVVALCLVWMQGIPSLASSVTVLDFEDLEDTNSIHTMLEHNPYHGLTFNEVPESNGASLSHHNNPDYAAAHSGVVYLFNAYGYDNIKIEFSTPVLFLGAYVGKPSSLIYKYDEAKEFWFEGYFGTILVGESEKLIPEYEMKPYNVNFGGPVDSIVLRRTPQDQDPTPESSAYTIDDITFDQLSTPDPLDNLDELTGDIEELDLPSGIENGLLAKISNAQNIITDENENNDGAAINVLEAFINQVEAQRGKKISIEDADELITEALAIIDMLINGN